MAGEGSSPCRAPCRSHSRSRWRSGPWPWPSSAWPWPRRPSPDRARGRGLHGLTPARPKWASSCAEYGHRRRDHQGGRQNGRRRRNGGVCRGGGGVALAAARNADRIGRDHGHRGQSGDRDRRRGLHAYTGREQALQRAEEAAQVQDMQRLEPTALAGVLESVGQGAPSAEDQRLGGRVRDLEALRDLAVRQALPLPEQDRPALALGEAHERVREADERVVRTVGSGHRLLENCDVPDPLETFTTPCRADPGEAHVPRDMEEPRGAGPGAGAAAEASAGVQIGRLHGVLGLLRRAEEPQAVAVQPA